MARVEREDDGLSLDQASRRVLNALPERIVVCSRSGEILFVNRLAEALLGWSAADLDGRHFADLLPRALRQIDAAPFHEVLLARGDEGTIRGSIVHRRGVQIEVDFAASSFGGGGDIALLLRRIAEKESPHVGRVEDTVRAETYRLVFEDAPVGIFHFDDRGVITACNESFTRIIGSSKRVLVGLDMTTLPFRPIVAPLKEALAGKLSRFEGAYPSATSDKLTQVRVEFAPIVSEDGAAVGGVGIAEDVTERVRAEHALRRAFESVRTLLESAPDAIAVHRDERFVLVNAAMVRMLGYDSATELLTAPVLSIIHPEDRSLSVDRRYEMARGSVMPAAEIRLLRKDGTTVVAEVASLRIHYDDEPAILTFSRDVTERRRLEARLAQADRMASIGTLAAGVAHEINNPLAYVMGNLDLLERALAARVDARADGTGSENSPRGDAKSMLSMLRDAREGCERMRNIVGDLRTFSRSETEERVQVDMRAAIDSAITMAQHEIQRRARLVREVQDVPAVLGDPTQLAQVILNLLVNAAQAIAEGHREEHTVCVGARESQGLVEVYVRDDGGGIPKEVIDRVFEPFFTTKPVGIGTGLGLSICRGIVQAHGGALEVESEVGRGTTFRLFLPWAHAPYAVSSGRLPTAEAKVWRARIVVIDDEPQLGRMLRTVLAPHDVAVATSGREGLEMLLSGAPPDLILCDVMMPDVSGVGVYDALRSERPELCDRFVFMTGGAFSEASLQFVAGPAARGLHKPFAAADVERLLASMRRT